jgi:hypothetical protein
LFLSSKYGPIQFIFFLLFGFTQTEIVFSHLKFYIYQSKTMQVNYIQRNIFIILDRINTVQLLLLYQTKQLSILFNFFFYFCYLELFYIKHLKLYIYNIINYSLNIK